MALTPHELREGLLHLARDILESQSRAKRNSGGTGCYPHGEDIITTEQIIEEAKKLNDFVSMVPGKKKPVEQTASEANAVGPLNWG